MKHQLRQVLPPYWAIAAFVVTYAAAELAFRRPDLDGLPELPDFKVPRLMVVAVAALLYGCYRAAAFHPLCRQDYARWLQTTPWTPAKPLLLGPIHLIWADALGLGVLEIAALRLEPEFWAVPLVAFFTGYLVPLALWFFNTGARRHGYAILFVLGLALLTRHWTWAIGIELAAYVVGLVGLRRSLEQFPWPLEVYSKIRIETTMVPSDPNLLKDRLGWPYSRLQPFAIEPAITCETGLLLSLLAAWYVYVIQAVFGNEATQIVAGAYALTLIGTPVGRIVTYLAGIRPPISLLGRLATGRPIIPGFDRVFVAPLATVACGVLIPAVLSNVGVNLGAALALAVGVMIWITTTRGPTLAEWRLTGNHRLSPGFGPGAMYTQL